MLIARGVLAGNGFTMSLFYCRACIKEQSSGHREARVFLGHGAASGIPALYWTTRKLAPFSDFLQRSFVKEIGTK